MSCSSHPLRVCFLSLLLLNSERLFLVSALRFPTTGAAKNTNSLWGSETNKLMNVDASALSRSERPPHPQDGQPSLLTLDMSALRGPVPILPLPNRYQDDYDFSRDSREWVDEYEDVEKYPEQAPLAAYDYPSYDTYFAQPEDNRQVTQMPNWVAPSLSLHPASRLFKLVSGNDALADFLKQLQETTNLHSPHEIYFKQRKRLPTKRNLWATHLFGHLKQFPGMVRSSTSTSRERGSKHLEKSSQESIQNYNGNYHFGFSNDWLSNFLRQPRSFSFLERLTGRSKPDTPRGWQLPVKYKLRVRPTSGPTPGSQEVTQKAHESTPDKITTQEPSSSESLGHPVHRMFRHYSQPRSR